MTILEMLGQSGILTLFGIGMVFTFLTIMVIVISQAGKMFHAADSDEEEDGPAVGKPVASRLAAGKPAYGNMAAPSNSGPITAAIAAAVGAHRKSGNKG
jgi:oxaloacetate decarboxylase gamma subunit